MKKLMIMVGVAAMAAGAFAGVSFGYQGTLCDAKGEAVKSAEKTIAFRLYTSQTAATSEALWGRAYVVKTGANGVFNVELTDDVGDKLPDGTNGTDLGKIIAQCAAASQPIYVGLTVSDGSGEIQPRQKMVATPYSDYAIDVGAASGDFKVAGALTVAGGINMAAGSSMTAGDVTAKTLVTSGDAAMDSGLTVKGNLEAQQDLAVGGALTVNSASTFTNVTVKGNLTATGTITDRGGEVGVPIGTIVMWAGSSSFLPPGWVVCNGEGTYKDQYSGETRQIPDLSGRFIVGVGAMTDAEGNKETYSLGQHDGGLNKHQLTTDEMPAHRHHYVSDDGLNGLNDTYAHCTAANKYKMDFDSTDNKGYKLGDYQNESVGKSQAHENRPPYYALYYIIKIGEK